MFSHLLDFREKCLFRESYFSTTRSFSLCTVSYRNHDESLLCLWKSEYFSDCYIEGHVDFIFGDAKAVFESCEIRSIAHGAGGYVTAQSNTRKGQDAGYVFDHCRLTADEGAGKVYLGRPWRDYSTVVYLNTEMGAHIVPEGWSEWKSAPVPRLPTATYAEFNSTGPGANAVAREPLSNRP